ncbi:MAG TPA: GNAT family N-acetyltransferase [Vicinamibacterales bacterium]|nr:GNAT family N-acetyltransferase [Vicinamibacterales bacterium]
MSRRLTSFSPARRHIFFSNRCGRGRSRRWGTRWRTGAFRRMSGLCWRGRGEMMISWHDGEPLATMITFYDGPRCFAFLGASTGSKRNLRPNDALFWEAMKRAMARGCQDFDFMISSRDDGALIAFKGKWGATRHPFLFFERDLAWLRCRVWNLAFRVARTSVGGAVLRWLRRRKE